MPSVTVVVRTQHDPGTGPQFTYLPPHVALDPVYQDALTMRRKQVLDMLEQMADPAYADISLEMISELDFERGFYILQNGMGCLKDLGAWDEALGVFEKKHGALAKGIGLTMEEGVRRDIIKDLRRSVTDPEHRFFLALLMNVQKRADLLSLIQSRYTGAKPVETVIRWLDELVDHAPAGIVLLDALFSYEEFSSEEDLLPAIRGLLSGRKPSSQARSVESVLRQSSLRVLLA
jgi:hypothetical protein